ncbi:hypothetical protein JMN32_00145 [Fulvivirga sp. 29W222]|uniref:Uncharacterized protein n=1 Tax=Fulvivirga marina TaxID=2494733 RepID=A0A937FTU8_9BACT|nr:hypothetical protein [Fulvivirga marina]MBL6444697.1 hypothetical protein [Fulvivirga marina]
MWFKKDLPDNLKRHELEALQAHIGHSHSDMNLVGQYENAVDILINEIIQRGDAVDLVAHPLLYLMRHTIELALKENIRYLNKYSALGLGKIKTHSIDVLFNEFERHYNKVATDLGFKNELETDYRKYSQQLKELIKKLGTDWSSFRYVKSFKGNQLFKHSETLNVFELKQKFDASMIFLTHTADAISPFTDFADYIKIDSSIVSKSFGRVLLCLDESQKEWLIRRMNEKYEVVKDDEIWFDKDDKQNLHLKIAYKKCYLIPLKE